MSNNLVFVKSKLLELYHEMDTIYGPYFRKKDARKFLTLRNSKTKKMVCKQFAKFLMEIKLNRILSKTETVDYIDGDKLNDELYNLQLLSRADNARKSIKRLRRTKANCVWCGKEFVLSRDQLVSHQDKAGPFCSKSCSGKYGTNIQHYNGKPISRVNHDKIYYSLDNKY